MLIENETGRVCFDLGAGEEVRFAPATGGWKHDWCSICKWELRADAGEEHSIGYTNGRQWLCTDCYERFFKNKPQ